MADQLTYPLSHKDRVIIRDAVKNLDTAIINVQLIGRAAMTTSFLNDGQSNEQTDYLLAVDVQTLDISNDFSRKGTQLDYQHQGKSAYPAQNTFLFAERSPFVNKGTGSIVNAGNTLTDTIRNFTVNELQGAVLYIANTSGSIQEAHTIASNTATVITINGTWAAATDSYSYTLAIRVYLGAANAPWRRLYTDEIRIGEGPSAGASVVWIRTGTGSPENVETAPPGSLFLRRDGGAGTSFYVKESGTGNTGWIAK